MSRLLAAIDERDTKAQQIHDERCNLVLGTISGNLNDECDCGVPTDLLRLCQAHQDIVAEWREARDAAAADESFRVAAFALMLVIRHLARGYGVEDGETK